MYHLASTPLSEPGLHLELDPGAGGVFVFQDETSSVNGNLSGVQSDVHVPESYVPEPSTCLPRS